MTHTQSRDSDLDLTVLTKDRFEKDERAVLENIYTYLRDRFKYLKFEKVLGQQVKVPLLSIEDSKKQLQVEITLNNLMGIANSGILAQYVQIHPKVHDFIILIKHWAKQNSVCNKHRMSSYALTLMVIYFFQQKGLLPVLQELNTQQCPTSYRKFIFGKLQEFNYNSWYEKDPEKIKAATKLDQLEATSLFKFFQDFFEFYNDP